MRRFKCDESVCYELLGSLSRKRYLYKYGDKGYRIRNKYRGSELRECEEKKIMDIQRLYGDFEFEDDVDDDTVINDLRDIMGDKTECKVSLKRKFDKISGESNNSMIINEEDEHKKVSEPSTKKRKIVNESGESGVFMMRNGNIVRRRVVLSESLLEVNKDGNMMNIDESTDNMEQSQAHNHNHKSEENMSVKK